MIMTTLNDNGSVRFPAEWERVGAVMVAWPHSATDWSYMLESVDACYVRLLEAITARTTAIIVTPDPTRLLPIIMMSEINIERIQWYVTETNDTWTRDYGPIITTSGPDDWQINDFKFNGWGLKFAANFDNLVTGKMCRDTALMGQYVNRLGFVLEGGSIETDGKGTLLTTSECLLSPNRNGNLTKQEIEQRLKNYLGVSRVLWLDHGALEGDDTDSHIDTLARLAPDDTIVYVGCDNHADSHYQVLKEMEADISRLRTSDGRPYRLVRLPLPDPIFDEEGMRLPATYANFLIINNAVLMPAYRQPEHDNRASAALAKAFPGYEIVPVDCTELIYQHGSLHCATMQLPYQILPLCHTPLESE